MHILKVSHRYFRYTDYKQVALSLLMFFNTAFKKIYYFTSKKEKTFIYVMAFNYIGLHPVVDSLFGFFKEFTNVLNNQDIFSIFFTWVFFIKFLPYDLLRYFTMLILKVIRIDNNDIFHVVLFLRTVQKNDNILSI